MKTSSDVLDVLTEKLEALGFQFSSLRWTEELLEALGRVEMAVTPRVLVLIERGVIQHVCTDRDMEVYSIDLKQFELFDAADSLVTTFTPEVGSKKIDEILQETREEEKSLREDLG